MNTLASQQMAVNSSRQSMSWAFKNHLSKGTLNHLQFCSNHSRDASAKCFKDQRQMYCIVSSRCRGHWALHGISWGFMSSLYLLLYDARDIFLEYFFRKISFYQWGKACKLHLEYPEWFSSSISYGTSGFYHCEVRSDQQTFRKRSSLAKQGKYFLDF